MFETNIFTAAKAIYTVLIGICAVWLAWICFANLPFWLAFFLLPFVLALLAAVGAPLGVAASFVGGLTVAGIIFIWHKAFRGSHSGV